jgi:NADH:ubiquinone oxidoreductase subunit F (NADH-binding)
MEKESADQVRLTLTIDQVIEIFRAGMRRGEEEASAFDWGCSPIGRASDDLVEALMDIDMSRDYASNLVKGKL